MYDAKNTLLIISNIEKYKRIGVDAMFITLTIILVVALIGATTKEFDHEGVIISFPSLNKIKQNGNKLKYLWFIVTHTFIIIVYLLNRKYLTDFLSINILKYASLISIFFSIIFIIRCKGVGINSEFGKKKLYIKTNSELLIYILSISVYVCANIYYGLEEKIGLLPVEVVGIYLILYFKSIKNYYNKEVNRNFNCSKIVYRRIKLAIWTVIWLVGSTELLNNSLDGSPNDMLYSIMSVYLLTNVELGIIYSCLREPIVKLDEILEMLIYYIVLPILILLGIIVKFLFPGYEQILTFNIFQYELIDIGVKILFTTNLIIAIVFFSAYISMALLHAYKIHIYMIKKSFCKKALVLIGIYVFLCVSIVLFYSSLYDITDNHYITLVRKNTNKVYCIREIEHKNLFKSMYYDYGSFFRCEANLFKKYSNVLFIEKCLEPAQNDIIPFSKVYLYNFSRFKLLNEINNLKYTNHLMRSKADVNGIQYYITEMDFEGKFNKTAIIYKEDNRLAFNISDIKNYVDDDEERQINFKLYSFATFYTIGYGDIVSTSKISKYIAMSEMVLGNIMTVIYIGMAIAVIRLDYDKKTSEEDSIEEVAGEKR